MTTPPSTGPRRRDIPALHAAIAPSSALHGQRRALYRLAAELLAGNCPQVLDHDVIDSPLTRHQIGDALAGHSAFSCTRLTGISALTAADSAAPGLRVVSRPEANSLLADALNHIGTELARQQQTSGPPRLLTEADGERFGSALAVLRDGLTLARSISVELTEDLLTHVALVAIVDPQRAGGLTSGSSRTFPGLVLLAGPSSGVEVAEALVHEGAHQKFFDLGITHDLLTADSDRCAPFHPPWAPVDRFWSLETTLAACHAYACLARFEQDAAVLSGARTVGAGSLLPVAGERRDIIGRWLLDKGDHLGADAHTLLEGLLGRRPRSTAVPVERRCEPLPSAAEYVVDTRLQVRRCAASHRVLIGLSSTPPQFYWVSEDAATMVELLGCKPFDEVGEMLAHRWQLPLSAAHDRLTVLLADLRASGLVIPKER